MKTNLVGGSNQERSLPLNAERTINLYPVKSKNGKETVALYGTDGIRLFATAGAQRIKKMFAAANGRVFAAASDGLYEVFTGGTTTLLGSFTQPTGLITIDENGLQLAVCDGTYVYTFIYSSNTFAKVTDVDLPSSGGITFIDGYFAVSKNSSGSFYISSLYDGTAWAALDFATAESSPDNLLRAINAVGQLWLFGNKTTEIWTNTGASAFPFERISGAKLEVGILAPMTATPLDNSIFWVGRDYLGSGIVYRANGFTPQRISTNAIEFLISQATTPEEMVSYAYEREGHVFYIITGGGLATTLCYDVSTGEWHERAYLNSIGVFEQHLGASGCYGFSKQLVGSRYNGKIYEMSPSYYDDDFAPLVAERTFTHISNENERLKFSQLEIAMETGVGLQTGQGENPQISLKISRDGGRTWSNEYATSFGAVGAYTARAIFRRLGQAFNWTFKIRITDPVKRVLIGGYLK